MVTILITAAAAFAIGAAYGKWLTDRRWMRSASQPFSLSCGGRLFGVEDVTPWSKESGL